MIKIKDIFKWVRNGIVTDIKDITRMPDKATKRDTIEVTKVEDLAEKIMGEIDEVVAKTRKVMQITKIDIKKTNTNPRDFWLITLHVTNPNSMLVYLKDRITDIIRSTYMFPDDDFGVIFITQDDRVEYDIGVKEVIDHYSHALRGADSLIGQMIREEYEGETFECMGTR